MTMESWLPLIDKYGLPIIALVVLIVWLAPKLDQLWYMVFPKPEPDRPKLNVEELFRTDSEVSKVLAEIVNKLDVGWATIWQFHNGATTMIGIPFLKVSATHSEVKRGYVRHAAQFQGLSTSLLGDLSAMLTEPFIRLSAQDTTAYGAIASSMKTSGIRSLYIKPLFSARNDLIGALSLSFKEDIVLGDTDLDEIRDYCARIVILLDRMSKIKDCPDYAVR